MVCNSWLNCFHRACFLLGLFLSCLASIPSSQRTWVTSIVSIFIVENFCRPGPIFAEGQSSKLLWFNFMDARDHAHYTLYNCAYIFVGWNFRSLSIMCKNHEDLLPLENFPPYSACSRVVITLPFLFRLQAMISLVLIRRMPSELSVWSCF